MPTAPVIAVTQNTPAKSENVAFSKKCAVAKIFRRSMHGLIRRFERWCNLMTEKDKEMQELRRENARLLKENKRLEAQHQADMAELVSVT